jgi:hypothetical protein
MIACSRSCSLDQLPDATDRKMMDEIRIHDGDQQQAARENRVIDNKAPKQANAFAATSAPAVRAPFSRH